MAKKKEGNLQQDLMEAITTIFLILMTGVFPFYYHNNYLDIVSSKKDFFQFLAAILLVLTLLLQTTAFLLKKTGRSSSTNTTVSKTVNISLTDLFALLFGAVIILSCCTSPGGTEAFWGNQGRRLGGLFLLLCIAAYYSVSRHYKSNSIFLWVFLLANICYQLLVVLNFWSIDPLHMYSNLIEKQYVYFIGTMGNININSGYMGVITALMMGLYYLAEERLSKICFFTAVILGIYTCFAIRSDSWLLSMFGAYIVLLFFSLENRDKLFKWWRLCCCFFFSSVLIKASVIAESSAGLHLVRVTDFRKQKLLYSLTDWRMLAAELLLLLTVYVLIKSPFADFLKKYGKWILTGLLAAAAAVTLFFLFPLEDSFGTNRGYIWKRTLENFRDYPIWQKLFGYGPNCFLMSMEERYGAEMRQLYKVPFIDAHNEFLQFLAVTGILGAVSYMGIQFSLLFSCIKSRENQSAKVLGCIGIISYLLQGLVNNPQVFTTPLYFCFLGIIAKALKKRS